MIAEELKKIKAFGSDRESSVTPEDIAAKEAELGIRLPEALVELYLTFHESAPVFSADYYFVPLHQLEIEERGRALAPRKMLIFAKFSADGTGDGFFLDDKNPEDPLVFRCRAQIKKPGDRTFIMPENGKVSVFLLWHTASRQLRCQPNIIQVSGKQFQGLWDNSRDDWDSAGCEALSPIFDWFLGPHPTEMFDLAGRPQQSPYGFVGTARQSGSLTCLSFGCALIAVDSARQIECVMEEIKGEGWKWLRRDGVDQTSDKPKPVKERKLESILPAIGFLKTYAGIQGEGILEEACIRAEKRTGFSLPAPLKEIWEQIPSSFLSAPARFLPMDEITAEEEKVHFLSGW